MPRSGGTSNLSMSHLIVTGSTMRSRPHHHQTKGQHANTKVWRRDSARLTFGLGQKPQVRKVRFWRKAVARHMVDVSATSKVWTAYRAVLTSMSCSRQKSTQAFLLFAPRMASCVDRECRELVGLTSTVSGGDRERFLLFFW